MTDETTLPGDPDAEIRDRLADAVAAEAVFDGWSQAALSAAAGNLGLPSGEAARLFPGGPLQVLAQLSERADRRTVADMEKAGVDTMKMRDRIRSAVRIRLENHAGDRESVRRGPAFLSIPFDSGVAPELPLQNGAGLWDAAGDTNSDFHFLTQRAPPARRRLP